MKSFRTVGAMQMKYGVKVCLMFSASKNFNQFILFQRFWYICSNDAIFSSGKILTLKALKIAAFFLKHQIPLIFMQYAFVGSAHYEISILMVELIRIVTGSVNWGKNVEHACCALKNYTLFFESAPW